MKSSSYLSRVDVNAEVLFVAVKSGFRSCLPVILALSVCRSEKKDERDLK